MTDFLYWSGVALWGLLAAGGLLAFGDIAIDWIVQSVWTKREFLAFVVSRLRRRSHTLPSHKDDTP